MYKRIIRPLLFLFAPETIHHFLVNGLSILFRVPGFSALIRAIYKVRDPRLETEFLGMKLESPVGLAAGFDKNGLVYNEFYDFGFSFIEVGTVTPEGQPGNPKPRSFRIPRDCGLINRMGFNNRGADAMVGQLQKKRRRSLVIGGNIGKNTATPNAKAAHDYEFSFRTLYPWVDYFVVNVSCPNITDLHELQDQDSLEQILSRLTGIRDEMDHRLPLLLKISPDLNNAQIDMSLALVQKLGLDGVVATNTTIKREGLKTGKKRLEQIGDGGMSGAPITGRSLEVVRYISEKTGGTMPIMGVGGIMSVEDALRMLDAGASVIQLYTGFIYEGPALIKRIQKAILERRLT